MDDQRWESRRAGTRLTKLSKVWESAADAHLDAKPEILLHARTDTEESSLRLKIAAQLRAIKRLHPLPVTVLC